MSFVIQTFIMSTAEKSNEGPRSDPGGIVRSASFAPIAEQSSEGPNSRGITGSAKRGVKRKLDNKSLETKYEVLIEVEKGTRSKKQIADQYGLAQSTLSTWLKKGEDIKNAYLNGDFSSKRKKLRTAGYPEVEEALLKWFKTARDHNVPISGPFMMQRAGELAVKLGIPMGEFKCSNGWLERFKERHGISFKRICGEEKSVDTESDQMDEWHRSLSMIMKEYTPDDIYNAEETGIFFRCMPDKTLEFKNIDCHGGKQSKERITGLVCANMSGTDKRPLLILGKSSKPRCFQNVRSFPTEYGANKKAWMTSEIFTNWVKKFDRTCQRQKRKCALIVDNCPAHPKVKDLKNVTLFFLPPNTTSKTQPMDQGLIRNLKHHYRKLVIARHLRAIEKKKEMEKITVLDAMYYLQQAWQSVNETTIANCYTKAGFKTTDDSSTDPSTDLTDSTHLNDLDDDPLDELPLARLVGANITMNDYVSVDDDVPTCEDISDDTIVDDIITARDNRPGDDDEDDDHADTANAAPVDPPSVDIALKACETLRLFLQQQSNLTDVLEKLCQVDKCVSQIDLSKRCAKQALITDFFRM